MDICVCIKRYPSLGSAIMLTDDGMAIDTDKLGFTLSPHEECAVAAPRQLNEEHRCFHQSLIKNYHPTRPR